MNFRILISASLVILGLIISFLPGKQNNAYHLKPDEMLPTFGRSEFLVSVDDVARFIVNEDSNIQIIDLRSPQEYKAFNIPGSINIPFQDMLNPDYEGYLNQEAVRNILYSNGDIVSSQAWTIARQKGFKNNFIMQGGINEWYHTVMLSEFSGSSISPKENAKFETRYKARKFFIQMNSLPDSLKQNFLAVKKKKELELVGGCE